MTLPDYLVYVAHCFDPNGRVAWTCIGEPTQEEAIGMAAGVIARKHNFPVPLAGYAVLLAMRADVELWKVREHGSTDPVKGVVVAFNGTMERGVR